MVKKNEKTKNELEFKKKVERHYKFRHAILGISENKKEEQKEIDIRNYAKYILREGSIFEKRELLSCLRSKLILENKKVRLEKK